MFLKQSNYFPFISQFIYDVYFIFNAKQNCREEAARSEIFERYFKIPSFRTLSTARWSKGPRSHASFGIRYSNFAISSNRGEEIREIPRESRGNNEVVMETRLSPPVGRSPSPRRFLRVGYSGLDKFV